MNVSLVHSCITLSAIFILSSCKKEPMPIVKTSSLEATELNEGKKRFSSLHEKKDNTIKKEVYVWSSCLELYSTSFLKNYCTNQGFNKLIVSANSAKKFNSLALMFKGTGVKIDLLIGSNDLVCRDVYQYLTNKLKSVKSQFQGIHLDVEIHTLSGWNQGNRAELEAKYIEMISKARLFCDQRKLKLYASIPVHYGQNLLNCVYSKCHKVYLMAYEHPNVDYIARKTTEELAFGKKRSVVALRTQDFSGKKEMEVFFGTLAKRLKVKRICYHDLSSLIGMND